MFITKKNTTQVVEGNSDSLFSLKVEIEKLKIENETLKFTIAAQKEKMSVLHDEINGLKTYDYSSLERKNTELEKQIQSMKFKVENDTSNIELETENKKLKSEVEIQKSENKHLKELLDIYRAMPDVKKLADNLSSLSVPGIEELKQFSRIISEAKISQLADDIKNNNAIIKDIKSDTGDLCRMVNYRR